MALAVDTYQLGPIGTNCYVVRADEAAREAVVVDPGGDAARAHGRARARGQLVRGDRAHAHALRPSRRCRRPRRGHGRARLRAPGASAAGSRARTSPPAARGARLRAEAADRGGDASSSPASASTSSTSPGHSPAHLSYYADGSLFSRRRAVRRRRRPRRPPRRRLGHAARLDPPARRAVSAGDSRLLGPRAADDARHRARDATPSSRSSARSATMKFQAPRGTHDVLPSEQPLWQKVTRHARRASARSTATAGSRRRCSRTPSSSSARPAPARTSCRRRCTSFEDRGGRSLALRPEGTAPICRAYIEHGMQREPQPVKLYTQATMYRYAAPQKRPLPRALAAVRRGDRLRRPCARRRGDPAVRRGAPAARRRSSGSCSSTRSATRTAARPTSRSSSSGSTRTTPALDDEARQKRATSPLRVFDVKSPARPRRRSRTHRRSASRSATRASSTSREVRRYLDAFGVTYTLVPTLVRGLDYYTRTTFEFVGPDEGAQSTICAGGRYDGLIEELGGPPTPGIGFGAGVERLVLALEQEGDHRRAPRLDLFFVIEPGARSCGSARRARQAARGGRRVRHRLRRALAQGSAHAARAFGRARVRARSRGRRDVERGDVEQDVPVERSPLRCSRERVARHATAASVTADDVGKRLKLAGWTARRRDHGGLVFIDLRDHTGLVQLVVNPDRAAEAAAVAHDVRSEFVLRARGRGRPPGARRRQPEPPDRRDRGPGRRARDRLPLRSAALPARRGERRRDVRLRYRYLDLRRDRMQRNMRLSANVIAVDPPHDGRAGLHRRLDPEHDPRHAGGRARLPRAGAASARQVLRARAVAAALQAAVHGRRARPLLPDRDVLARRGSPRRPPVRVPPARPRAGVPIREDVLEVLERVVVAAFEASGATAPKRPFPRLAYAEAMLRYGTDKPDLRFGLEIQDATEVDARLRVRRLRGRAGRSLPRRAAAFSRARARKPRGVREGVGCEGARVPRRRRVRRGALADREVPLGERAGSLPRAARLDRALRAPTPSRWSSACSVRCARISARSSA